MITIELSDREARALMRAAWVLDDMARELCPSLGALDRIEPPALITAQAKIELALVLTGAEL